MTQKTSGSFTICHNFALEINYFPFFYLFVLYLPGYRSVTSVKLSRALGGSVRKPRGSLTCFVFPLYFLNFVLRFCFSFILFEFYFSLFCFCFSFILFKFCFSPFCFYFFSFRFDLIFSLFSFCFHGFKFCLQLTLHF